VFLSLFPGVCFKIQYLIQGECIMNSNDKNPIHFDPLRVDQARETGRQ
jgi:hypothetical protein